MTEKTTFGPNRISRYLHTESSVGLCTCFHTAISPLVNSHNGNSHRPIQKPGPYFAPRGAPPTPQRTLDLKLGGCKSDPYAMREHWIQVARSSRSVEDNDVEKVFSKHPKIKVATPNTLRASALRRKHPAKFKCPVDGCCDDFTRKHNLESVYFCYLDWTPAQLSVYL